MESQEYPLQHFQLMAKLAGDLVAMRAQILEHGYHCNAFGSWWTTLQRRGIVFRIVFDGKERELRLERATRSDKAESWEELDSWSASDPDGAGAFPEVVARLRAV